MYTIDIGGQAFFNPAVNENGLERPEISLDKNRIGELSYTIYPNHASYSQIEPLTTTHTVYIDGEVVDVFRVARISRAMRGGKTVKCESMIAAMNDLQIREDTFTGTIAQYITHIITLYNASADYTVYAGTVSGAPSGEFTFKTEGYNGYYDTLISNVVNTYGGYIIPRYDDGKLYVDYYSAANLPTCSQQIKFGENLDSILLEQDGTELFTVLIPIGAENITIKSVNNNLDYIENAAGIAAYGRRERVQHFDKISNAPQLLAAAQDYLAANAAHMVDKTTISAVDLTNAGVNVDALRWMHLVHAYSEIHNVNQDYVIESIKVPLGNPQSARIKIGARSALSDIMQEQYNILNFMAQTVRDDGKRITTHSTQIDQNTREIALRATTETVNALGDRVSATESSLTLVPNQIKAAVDSVSVGGANLFKGTKGFSGSDWVKKDYGWTYSTDTYNGCNYAYKSIAWNCMTQKIWVLAGEQYTYSAWMKCSASQTLQWLFYRDGTTSHCTVEGNNTGFIYNVGTDWQRVFFTVKVQTSGWAEPGIDCMNNGITWYICGIKFERGNKNTYWMENDEDLRSYTNAEFTVLDNAISSKVSQSDFDLLGNRVSAAESSISQTPSQITAAVTAVQVGGTNLFTGTKNFTDDGQWTRLAGWTITSNTYNDCVIAQKAISWNCMSQKVWVEAGAEYTYSMWIKASSAQTVQWLFYRDATTDHCTVEGEATGRISGVDTTWQRISFTKTVATSGWAEPEIDVQNNGVTWYVCGIKFERGNKATDWSEAQGEVYAGTTVKITKDEFKVSTPKFGVDIVNSSEHFTLDSNGGTMDTLTINKSLNAPNIAYRYTGPANVTIGPSGTYKSLAEFANAINNKVLPSKDSIIASLTADQTGTIYLGGMSGMGGVVIYGNGYSFNGSLTIAGTNCYMWLEGLTVSGDLTLNRCRYVRLDNIMFNSSALTMTNGTTCLARKCQWANTNTCFSISYSRLIAWKCRGGNSNGNAIWGVGAIVQWDTATSDSSPWQSGESTNMRPLGNVNLTASLTVPANILTSVTPTSLNGTTPTPPSTITTTSFNCKASKTAYDGTHWHGDNRIRQGYYDMGSSGMNEQYGCFWFDTSALSGKTVKSALLTVTRISGYGRSSEVNVHLYTTPLTSGSGNPTTNSVDHGVLGTIGNGETKQFTIPTAAISASANKGFMLRVDDGAVISGRSYSTNYAHFYGYGETTPPVLTVTYQ